MECSICLKKFANKSNLNRHSRRSHAGEMILSSNTDVKSKFYNKCLEGCDLSFQFVLDLIKHLEKEHNILNELQDIQFTDMAEFKDWLGEEEKRECCHFFKKSGERLVDEEHKRSYYWCSRSGRTTTVTQRKRGLRTRGSKKIDFNCTSHIVVNAHVSKPEVNIAYWKEHYGHTKQIEHLPVPRSTSKAIANQLMRGISNKRILKGLRDNISKDKLDRNDLITNKDIQNIKKKFEINLKVLRDEIRRENDSTNVHMFEEECEDIKGEEEETDMDFLYEISTPVSPEANNIRDQLRKDLIVIMSNIQKIDEEKLHDLEKEVKSLRILSDILVEQSCYNQWPSNDSFTFS